MAVITSTVDNISLSSSFRCTTQITTMYVSIGGSSTSQVDYMTYSTPSTDSEDLVFTYSALPTDEPIQAVVLSMAGGNTPFGGVVKINDETVYKSADQYVAYLDASIVGSTSTTIKVSFQSYGHTYNHQSNADSSKLISTSSSGIAGEYTETYQYYKSHESVLALSDITLKIYTGDDFASAPSTSALFIGVDGIAKKVTDMFVGVNGVAKKISDAWIGVNGVARKFWPCLELKDVPAGSIIQLDEAGDGTLVDYIVVAQNHYLNDTNTEGHTVFMRKNILNTTTQYGDNTYGECYKDEALDRYVNETWKASLDGRIIMKLMDITIPCTTWSHPYTSFITRQVWVPARAELDNSSDFIDHHEAPCFAYFENITTNAERVAYNDSGTASAWWTRSCVEGMGTSGAYIRVVNAEGNYTNFKETVYTGVRPVFCLPNSLPVSQIAEGQYDLIL